jgi:hypothetical protein
VPISYWVFAVNCCHATRQYGATPWMLYEKPAPGFG